MWGIDDTEDANKEWPDSMRPAGRAGNSNDQENHADKLIYEETAVVVSLTAYWVRQMLQNKRNRSAVFSSDSKAD